MLPSQIESKVTSQWAGLVPQLLIIVYWNANLIEGFQRPCSTSK